jgi:hypothetical protein
VSPAAFFGSVLEVQCSRFSARGSVLELDLVFMIEVQVVSAVHLLGCFTHHKILSPSGRLMLANCLLSQIKLFTSQQTICLPGFSQNERNDVANLINNENRGSQHTLEP